MMMCIIQDIAEWLEAGADGKKHFGTLVNNVGSLLGPEYRPVPLEIKIMTFRGSDKTKDNMFLYERNLTYKLPAVIDQYSDGKPVLVFCAARKVSLRNYNDNAVFCQY